MSRILTTAFLICISLPAFGGKFNTVLSIGEKAPDLTGLKSAKGEDVTFENFKDSEVVVLAFTCNTCPYAVDYEDRMIAFAKKFAERSVKLVAINSNAGDKDTLEAMAERASEKQFPFPYLKDESGTVGKRFGALRTPEFVVLDRNRKVVYLGAMDDDPQGKKVTQRYVDQAVEAALAGALPEVTETPPIGCSIKYPRERNRSR